MFLPWIAFGGYLFWGAIAIVLLLMMFLDDEDFSPILSVISVTIALMVVFVDGIPWRWFLDLHNYLTVAMFAAGYVALGVGWSFAKWMLLLQEKAKLYEQQKSRFQSDYEKWKDKPGASLSFAAYVKKYEDFPPSASQHKHSLKYWAFFWPVSVLKFMLYDFFRKFWDFVYGIFSGLYQRVSDFWFSKFPELKD